jgi:hypothetical protein
VKTSLKLLIFPSVNSKITRYGRSENMDKLISFPNLGLEFNLDNFDITQLISNDPTSWKPVKINESNSYRKYVLNNYYSAIFNNTSYIGLKEWGVYGENDKLFGDDTNSNEIIDLELDHEVYRNYPDYEVTTYQWYKGEKPDLKNKIEGATGSTYSVTEADNGAQTYYCLEVSNTLNGITTIGDKYRLYRVTQYPKSFTEDDIIFNYKALSNGTVSVDGDGFTFGIKENVASDGYDIEVYY